jgi:hypothetical protein
MANTLKQQITADVAGVFLDTDEFAEAVTYIPASGSEVSITVIIEEEDEFLDENQRAADHEFIRVFTALTSAGIKYPTLGDAIKRSATEDEGQRLYGWTGQREDPERDSWWLVFRRTKTQRHGTDHKAT